MAGGGLFGQPSAEAIVERAAQADIENNSLLEGYTATRRYVITSPKFARQAAMTVRVTFRSAEGKTFEILSSENAEGMQKRILLKILDGERDASRATRGSEHIRLSPSNYTVQLLGSENKNGHECFVLSLKPKRKSKFLLEGKAWVSTSDYGLVEIEGRPSERISFWVGKPQIRQTFQKYGPVWVLSANRSVADVRLVGRSELSIESSGVEVKLAPRQVAAARTAK
jgi:hypothetical protein